jgi:hypothetical protein
LRKLGARNRGAAIAAAARLGLADLTLNNRPMDQLDNRDLIVLTLTCRSHLHNADRM